ncbi:hypothetical protein DPO11_25030 [Salmonella enterica]|nr:hypothetical protein [Salmonella enterica]EKK2412053.1 hypothetical protein [Salmonella enterica]
MKLAVRNISKSESHVTGSVSIDSNLLWTTFPFCSFQVCVDRVDGKSLEQYESDLLEVARERIAEIYKEIVCGGELDEEIIIPLSGKLSGKFNIRVVNKNGKPSVAGLVGEASDMLDCFCGKIEPSELSKETLEQIHSAQSNNDLGGRIAALEKHLGEQTSPDMLKTIHEVGTVRLQVSECEEYSVCFPFRIAEKCGQLFVHDEEGVRPPTHKHRDVIIDRVIRDLKSENGNMLKCLGRCMGLLQVAAEIEAVSQMCESKCNRCRESILSDFDNPPFKNVPTGWISPGVKYLKRRI